MRIPADPARLHQRSRRSREARDSRAFASIVFTTNPCAAACALPNAARMGFKLDARHFDWFIWPSAVSPRKISPEDQAVSSGRRRARINPYLSLKAWESRGYARVHPQRSIAPSRLLCDQSPPSCSRRKGRPLPAASVSPPVALAHTRPAQGPRARLGAQPHGSVAPRKFHA